MSSDVAPRGDLGELDEADAVVREGEQIDPLVRLANWFHGLDDPVRLGILEAMRDGEKSVDELCVMLGMKQPRISNHLACLRACRFVATRRKAQRVYYRLADWNVPTVLDLARASVARSARLSAHTLSQ